MIKVKLILRLISDFFLLYNRGVSIARLIGILNQLRIEISKLLKEVKERGDENDHG